MQPDDKKETNGKPLPKFSMQHNSMTLESQSFSGNYPVRELPKKMVQWINDGRKTVYRQISDMQPKINFFPGHLPVVTTFNAHTSFPFNSANKGVGFIPRAEYLEEYIQLFQQAINGGRSELWKKSIRERVAAASKFYFNRDIIDYRCLGTLEIFEKQTFANITEMPLASLLYTGTFPSYMSFQVNCGIEIIDKNDLRYMFIMLSRLLFEYDGFHITQNDYPYAYIFWVSEVIEKTPYRVAAKEDTSGQSFKTTDISWDEEAVHAVNRAPGMLQQYIREQIEGYARQRGFSTISLQLLEEAQLALRT
jgi:hypothetical protein